MTSPKYASLDGEIVAWDDARVHIASAGFKFGTGVFEGLRGYWNAGAEEMYLFRMAEHMNRLEFSQRFMRFDEIITAETVTEKTIELVQANGFKGENLHIMTTAFVSGMGGVTAQVSSWMRVPDNAMPMRVKCNANYNNGRLATVQAVADGYDTAIFLNSRGKVSEGPGMCFFMVRDGVPITPSVTSDILESITRETVLEMIEEIFGVKPVERDVDRSELMAADEAFFCGTAWEVTPVLGIDRVNIGDGSIGSMTKRLQDAFFAVCDGSSGTHAEWRLPIYGTAAALKAAE
jgi:branched-chain amino acid aminotransferase